MGLLAKSSEPRWLGKALKRLIALADQWNVEVIFEEVDRGQGEFIPDDMEIKIDSRLTKRAQLNYMLHELGHAQIHLEGLTRSRYTGWDDSVDMRSKLSLVEEEFEAWHRGRLIARQVGIVLDESYEVAREDAMVSYVKWCVRDDKIHHVTSGVVGGREDEHAPVNSRVPCLDRIRSDPATKCEGAVEGCALNAAARGGPLLKATVPEGVEEACEGETKGSCETATNGQQPARSTSDAEASSPPPIRSALRLCRL